MCIRDSRHTIETGGTDPYGGFPKVAPGGGTYSVRLGNNGTGAQAERLIFSFIVGPEDTNFIYKYAVVFEDPGHPENEQPYFELQILNSQNQIISCGQQHYTAASNIPGFINAGGMVWYKPWTTVGIRLANYVGQPVTVIVTNADCSRRDVYKRQQLFIVIFIIIISTHQVHIIKFFTKFTFRAILKEWYHYCFVCRCV